MRNSLSEQPKAQKHEYVVKTVVTPAVFLLCKKGKESLTGHYMGCLSQLQKALRRSFQRVTDTGPLTDLHHLSLSSI